MDAVLHPCDANGSDCSTRPPRRLRQDSPMRARGIERIYRESAIRCTWNYLEIPLKSTATGDKSRIIPRAAAALSVNGYYDRAYETLYCSPHDIVMHSV